MPTLTIRDISDAQINEFKELTHESTASKALIRSAEKGVTLNKIVEHQNENIKEMRFEIQRLNSIINSISDNCVQVLEVVGQNDVFFNQEY